MLKTIRKNRSGVVGLLIVSFCVLLMAGFGIDAFFGNRPRGPVATVNGSEISYNEFYRSQQQLLARYRQQFGEAFDAIAPQLNTSEQALDFLITDYLLRDFATQLKLTASTAQIEQYIAESPFFGGSVTPEAFKTYLRAVGMSSTQLEEAMRQELVRNQLRSLLIEMNPISSEEQIKLWQDRETTYTLRYLTLNSKAYRTEVETTNEAALNDYFTARQETYRTPRKVAFNVVPFKPEDYIASFEISEQDLRIAYEDLIDEFYEPAQVRLRQIFFKKEEAAEIKPTIPIPELSAGLSTTEADEEQSTLDSLTFKRVIAEKALERLATDEDFSILVAEFSEDLTTKDKGGDMGLLAYESLLPQLRDAARRLDTGEHSGIIETDLGLHILYLEEEIPRQAKDFELVRNEIENRLRQADAPVYTYAEAESFFQEWGSSDLALYDFAKSKEKALISIENPIAINDSLPTGIDSSLIKQVVEQALGNKDIIEIGDNIYIIEITAVKESIIPELNEIKVQVLADFMQDTAIEIASSNANAILNELAQGAAIEAEAIQPSQDILALAEKYNAQVEVSIPTKLERTQEKIFNIPGVKDAIRGLNKDISVPNRVFQLGEEFYLVQLIDKTIPEIDAADSMLKSPNQEELSQRENRMLESLVAYLKAKAEIEINNSLLHETF